MEITTLTVLAGGDERIGLFELAVLERRLRDRIDDLDARVQRTCRSPARAPRHRPPLGLGAS